ncbi:MAG: histidine kinase [Hyphomicrobiales bacterium]|nr:histidine kinase [Hyphomicrobiales bacterium]
MIAGWAAVLTSLVYLCALFAVAHYGDTSGRRFIGERMRPFIYAMTLGIYCTSWTFFGSVGLASEKGLEFLPIYIGPALVIGLGYKFVIRIIRLSKSQNITSVADFVAARFGKSQHVAGMVALIAVLGAVPYIALQLKAIAVSLTTVLSSLDLKHMVVLSPGAGALSMLVTVLLAGFAMAFGTRHIDATEHQDGLMLAVAAESVVKLVAFLCVGIYVTWFMFNGFTDLAERATANVSINTMLSELPDPSFWVATILISACCIVLLPRQFHVTVVENRNERDVVTTAWLFPLYLIAINVFVIPIAIAGRLLFPEGAINRDMTVLALPLLDQASVVALIALVGGLSAATAMVVVSSVALSIMISNDLVMPALLRNQRLRAWIDRRDLGSLILVIRRLSIILLLMMGFLYFRFAGEAQLASIGLLSFAAIAQIAPAFIGGLVWRRANARGAIAGLMVGIAFWAYTLLIPSLDTASLALDSLVVNGPMGIGYLKPTALFGLELKPLVHGVMWSLSLNVLAFVGFSLTRHPSPIERLQAQIFVGTQTQATPISPSFRLWGGGVTARELEATVGRYLGAEHTKRAFETFMATRGMSRTPALEADVHLLRFAEHMLASAIGAASSRLVLSILLRRRNLSRGAALQLIDEASSSLQQNRDMLQYALDFARQGITVCDPDLRLICWNREFGELFDLPPDKLRTGLGLEEIVRYNAERGIYGPGSADDYIATRLELLVHESEPFRLRLQPPVSGVIEIRSARLPDGGIVTTYTDVSEQVAAEEALERTNETLEQRVRQRTEELVQLNEELARAKGEADEANLSKTRFLAAASHDILQPLNAARLYATSLLERMEKEAEAEDDADVEQKLARNLDMSLESVEEILTALLDISRLDSGAMKAEISHFRLDEILRQLRIEFEPTARERGLTLTFVPSSVSVRSDRRLLRRLLQNLVSNAIKYTPKGRVLVGCRRVNGRVRVEIWDTGLGIPQSKQKSVFKEFERLAPAAKTAPGLGLGLSIVERLSKVLRHRITLRSKPGVGSVFGVEMPVVPSIPPVPDAPTAPAPRHQPLAGMVVLAIDNEPRILEGMQALLSGWGCRVIAAGSQQDAEAAIAAQGITPAAIVADYHLDEADGIEAIMALRWKLGSRIPALLVTADRTPEVRDRAAEKSISVLNKPLKPAALRSLLSQWRITSGASA